jgi:two-component system response regulator
MPLNDVEILLVEDDACDAELTLRALSKRNMGNRIHHVSDGSEALDFLFGKGAYARAITTNPKLVLLDLKLPKVTGLEVLRRMKTDDRVRTIPVVVLTSSQEDIDLRECYALGVNSYVVKPVEFDHFSKAVAELGLYWMLVNRSPP